MLPHSQDLQIFTKFYIFTQCNLSKIIPLGKHAEIQTIILNMQTFLSFQDFSFPSTSLIEMPLINSTSFERGHAIAFQHLFYVLIHACLKIHICLVLL